MADQMDYPAEVVEHRCGQVRIDTNGVVSYPKTIVNIGDCGTGCCDDYKCTVCGQEFRIEWPD